jgi:hypothetical protein
MKVRRCDECGLEESIDALPPAFAWMTVVPSAVRAGTKDFCSSSCMSAFYTDRREEVEEQESEFHRILREMNEGG